MDMFHVTPLLIIFIIKFIFKFLWALSWFYVLGL